MQGDQKEGSDTVCFVREEKGPFEMVQEEDVKVMKMMDDWGRIPREVVLRDLN